MIDTHCHIDLYQDPLSVAIASERARIKTIAVTYLPSHYEAAISHLKSFNYVKAALGLHPLSAHDHAGEREKFSAHIKTAPFIGEIGLDFTAAARKTKIEQERSFEIVLDGLKRNQQFVTLHSRGAENAVLAGLKANGVHPVVFHWFSGSKAQLFSVIDAGHYVSLNPAMAETPKWSDLIKSVPKEKVLTESDGPFAKMGRKVAAPNDMHVVLTWLAEQWRISSEEAEEIVEMNFARLWTWEF